MGFGLQSPVSLRRGRAFCILGYTLPMDEADDISIQARELLAIEILADLDPQRLITARDRIIEGIAGAVDEREADIRRHAVSIIDDALQRFDVFTVGDLIRTPD